MSFSKRTHGCGELRASLVGQKVTLNGWVHRVRDLGGVVFIHLRDRTGISQLVLDPAQPLPDLRSETCIAVSGEVLERTESTKNPKLSTGDVEVKAENIEVLGESRPLPFPVSDEEVMGTVSEELRVKHRYLDLRRPSMYRILAIRAALTSKMRRYLDARGFLEIETPIITKSTPEGARDYLVPYRLEPGKFYALPQSPQQYKQLLMVAGCERYYQIAKCFRDESQRADRQPEFTQLDLEMSFITQEDILNLGEGLVLQVINEVVAEFELNKDPVQPLPRLTYDEAMRRFGCDKPDLRFGLELFDVSEALKNTGFGVFKNVLAGGGVIKGVRYPGGAGLARTEVEALEEFCKGLGAKGMARLSYEGGELKGNWAKYLTPEEIAEIVRVSAAEEGDLLCFGADNAAAANAVLYRLRLEIGDRLNLRDPRKLAFCWVIDFPLVEWDAETKSWSPSHHPFTMPKHQDLGFLESDPGRVRADCYDLVCNGMEMASGSIRIHRSDIQARIFTLLGISEEIQSERFGHLLEAFSYGAPPHGGIAPGIDRLVMQLVDTENIREVMAFPKMGNGYDPMMDAPSSVDETQWRELGLQLRPPKK
jgi:aspartyl-tRNA synthetase